MSSQMPISKKSQRWVVYALLFLILTLSLFTVFGERGALHLWRLREDKRKLDENNFLLQKENERLRERTSRLRHDDLYLEKIAREELNLVRPGEIIYRFPPAESKIDRTKELSDLPSGQPRSSAQKEPR